MLICLEEIFKLIVKMSLELFKDILNKKSCRKIFQIQLQNYSLIFWNSKAMISKAIQELGRFEVKSEVMKIE